MSFILFFRHIVSSKPSLAIKIVEGMEIKNLRIFIKKTLKKALNQVVK